MRVIGYAYDADLHCPGCATVANMTGENATDSEGNPVGVLFDTDETGDAGPEHCGTCGDPLRDEWWGESGEPDDSMDGDHESGLASAGFGTDEDYGYYGDEGYEMYGPDE